MTNDTRDTRSGSEDALVRIVAEEIDRWTMYSGETRREREARAAIAAMRNVDAAVRLDQAPSIGSLIADLTEIARRTRVVGKGTENEHTEPVDLADIVAQVLTSVAANVGGVEELLAGRSGSWEADHVRQLVEGTAGYDPADLLAYRTLDPLE